MSANIGPVYEKGAHVGRKGSGVQSNPIRRVRPSRAHRLSTMWRRAVLRLMVPHGKTRPGAGGHEWQLRGSETAPVCVDTGLTWRWRGLTELDKM